MSSEADAYTFFFQNKLRYSFDILGSVRATGFEPSLYCFQHAADLGKLGARLLRRLGFLCGLGIGMALVLDFFMVNSWSHGILF
jgi:hypothetical protein